MAVPNSRFCSRTSSLNTRLTPVVTHLPILDIAVGAYLLYGLFNAAFVADVFPDALWMIRWGALTGGYALFRALPDKRWVIYGLILSGVAQTVIALGQHQWLLDSHHLSFRVTGSFGNPGQLGGYLAVCFIAAFWQATGSIRSRAKTTAVIFSVATLIIGAGLVLADSRAGLLGAMCGVGICFLSRKCRRTQTCNEESAKRKWLREGAFGEEK